MRVRWLVGLLLLIPIVGPLLVGTYARNEPELAGFPFYYWYQLLWIPIGAACTAIAYRLLLRAREREAGQHRPGGESA